MWGYSLYRDERPELEFPPCVKVGNLTMRSRDAILQWVQAKFYRKDVTVSE